MPATIRRSLLAICALAASVGAWTLLSASASAADGRIIFVCGTNLCSVSPQGGAVTRVTTDGTDQRRYSYPALTPDGTQLAAVRGTTTLVKGTPGGALATAATVGHPVKSLAISPDGKRLVWGWEETSVFQPPMDCRWINDLYQCSVVPQEHRLSNRFGFVPDTGKVGGGVDAVFRGATGDLITRELISGRFRLCVRPETGDDSVCAPQISAAGDLDLLAPAASPSGNLIAGRSGVVGDDQPKDDGGLDVYRADGTALGTVARGISFAASPAFSPDETAIAYAGADGGIWVVPVAGGTPVRVADGSSPTWGAAAAAARPLAWVKPATVGRTTLRRGGRLTLRVACGARCRLRGDIRYGGRTLARGTAARTKAGTATLRLRPTHSARAVRRGQRVTVRVRGTVGGKAARLQTRVRVR